MLCGRFNSPQFEHSWKLGTSSAWWLRRMLRFEGEVFLLGTAMRHLGYYQNKKDHPRLARRSKPRGGGRMVANEGAL